MPGLSSGKSYIPQEVDSSYGKSAASGNSLPVGSGIGGGESVPSLPPTTKPMGPELGSPIISMDPPLSKIMKGGPMGASISETIGHRLDKTGLSIKTPSIMSDVGTDLSRQAKIGHEGHGASMGSGLHKSSGGMGR